VFLSWYPSPGGIGSDLYSIFYKAGIFGWTSNLKVMIRSVVEKVKPVGKKKTFPYFYLEGQLGRP
jgi:hypothetical protein